jgi:hypothetical protein
MVRTFAIVAVCFCTVVLAYAPPKVRCACGPALHAAQVAARQYAFWEKVVVRFDPRTICADRRNSR